MMRIEQQLISYKGFSAKLQVTDGNDGNYSRFIAAKGNNVYLNMSVFLSLGIFKEGATKDENQMEYISISPFDIYKLKACLREVESVITSDYYTEETHIEKGLMLKTKPEYKNFFSTFINSTKKGQFGIGLKYLIDRDTREYKPGVVIAINSDDLTVTMENERFLAISDLLLTTDFQSAGRELIAVYLANQTSKRQYIEKSKAEISCE